MAPLPRKRVWKPEIRSLRWAATPSPQPKTSHPSLADHDPGDRIKIVWIDQLGSQHAATVTLGASPVA